MRLRASYKHQIMAREVFDKGLLIVKACSKLFSRSFKEYGGLCSSRRIEVYQILRVRLSSPITIGRSPGGGCFTDSSLALRGGTKAY